MSATPPTDPWPLPELTRARRAIVVVDVVESVRLMQEDEAGFIDRWRRFVHEVRTEVLPKHGGRMVKSLGDGMLLEFEAVPPAVAVAHELHALSSAETSSLAFLLRIGVHLADVVVDEIDVFGSGVNLAARLTQLAGPGQTVMSAQARECVLSDFDAQMEDLGECYLKHIAQPMRAFRVAPTVTGFGDTIAPHADTTDLRPTVAVLPFASYEAGASGVCVGDVVTDQVIAALSRSPSINVISRLSTTAFRQRTEPLTRIASALGAHFVASGRYRSSNGMLQVQVELADARTGHVLWSHSTVDSESAALVPDSDLVRTVSEGIAAAMFAAEVGSVRGLPLPNLQSHTLLIAAISLLYRLTLVDFDRARAALDALQERAPRHPAPLAWLARWHLFRVVQGWSDDRQADGRAALAYARRALDLDAESSLALTMLGNVSTSFVRDLDAAQRWYDRALSINPNESLAWLQKGNCLSFAGDGAAALQHVERAVALSPLDPARHFYLSLMASSALSAGNNACAMEAATASLRLNADHVSTYRVLAIAQSLSGLMDDARRTATRLMTLEPDLTVARFVARSPGAASGLARTFGDALHAAGVPMGS